MRNAIVGVVFILAVAGGLDKDDPLPSVQWRIGGKNVVYVESNISVFVLGDSQNTLLLLEQERDRRIRVEADNQRGESYTGRGEAEVIGTSWENCVQYAKRITGITRSIGAGGRSGVQSSEPRIGAIGAEKGVVHAVVIEKIEGNKITITEANWYRGKITRRVLSRNDFIGFIYR